MDKKHAVDVLQEAHAFCETNQAFHQDLNRFLRKHADKFMIAIRPTMSVEHPLEWTELYHEYLAMFESHLMLMLDAHGCTPQSFYKECQRALEKGNMPKNQWFVERLIGSLTYEDFFTMMVQEARGMSHCGNGALAHEQRKE